MWRCTSQPTSGHIETSPRASCLAVQRPLCKGPHPTVSWLGAVGLVRYHRILLSVSAGFFSKALENVVRFLPPMRIGSRQNPGCVGGTKCQFFAFCWMSGGSLGASCGPLHTCCVTPSSQDIQPQYWGPVINDPRMAANLAQIAFCLTNLVLLLECGKSATRISRIVGGSDASFGQFPWQVKYWHCLWAERHKLSDQVEFEALNCLQLTYRRIA